jgi:tetratricopeptide (TPR) repeat protein
VFVPQENCAPEDPACIAKEMVGQFVLYATIEGELFRRMVVGERIDERGFDGKTGWNLINGASLSIENEQQSLASREDALLHWYLDTEARKLDLQLVEARSKDHDGADRTLDGIRWQSTEGQLPDRTMWFDRETGLLREEVEQLSPDSQLVIIYDEYREVDGVKVPHEIRQIEEGPGGQSQIDIHVQGAHHRELREGLFAIPQLAPPKPAADEYLTMLAEAQAAAAANPKELIAQMDHARISFAVAHFDESKAALNKALALEPNEPEALWFRARIALLQGDFKSAKRDLDKAKKIGLREEEWSKQMAWIHSHQRKWAKVGDNLRTAGQPDLADTYDALIEPALKGSFAGRACSATTPISKDTDFAPPVIQATIEGREVKLLLDTGTRDLILGETLARELLITRDADSPIGATGGPPLPHGQVETLEIGTFKLEHISAALVPDAALAASAVGVDGVLGVRPLLDYQVIFDNEKAQLEIFDTSRRCARKAKANRVGNEIPFVVHETHFVYLNAKINDSETVLLLNTGMRGADIAASTPAHARAGIGQPVVVGDEMGLANVRSFALVGGDEYSGLYSAYGVFEGAATTDNFRLDGMVGLRGLGPGRVVIDFPRRHIYAPPAPETKPPTPKSTPGKASK